MYELLQRLETLITKWEETTPYSWRLGSRHDCAKELREAIGTSINLERAQRMLRSAVQHEGRYSVADYACLISNLSDALQSRRQQCASSPKSR